MWLAACSACSVVAAHSKGGVVAELPLLLVIIQQIPEQIELTTVKPNSELRMSTHVTKLSLVLTQLLCAGNFNG